MNNFAPWSGGYGSGELGTILGSRSIMLVSCRYGKQPACHNEPLVEGRLTRGTNTVADLWSQDLLYTEPFVAGSFVAEPFKAERFEGVPAA